MFYFVLDIRYLYFLFNKLICMNAISIRIAEIKDLKILLDFEQGIIEAERPYDPTLKPEKISYYDIKKMLSEENTAVIIAEINNKIVGSGYAKIIKAKPYLVHDNYAYLGFMFTDSDFRGMGINSKIIAYLKNWCISRNVFEMRLDVYNDNPSAIKAYEKSGFKKHLVNMRIGLDQN